MSHKSLLAMRLLDESGTIFGIAPWLFWLLLTILIILLVIGLVSFGLKKYYEEQKRRATLRSVFDRDKTLNMSNNLLERRFPTIRNGFKGITCQKCGDVYRPFPFFIRICHECHTTYCQKCWKDIEGVLSCPECEIPLSQFNDDEMVNYVMLQLINAPIVKMSRTPQLSSLPSSLKAKIFFNSKTNELSIKAELSNKELQLLLGLFDTKDDKKKIANIYVETKKHIDELKGQQLDIDMTCVPICHFNS